MPEILTPHINDYPNKEAYQRCDYSCPYDLPEGHLIADHPKSPDWLKEKEIKRLQDERNQLLLSPTEAEHQRLRDKVVEAAKVWAAHPETPKPLSEDGPLYDAIVDLEKFEEEHKS